MNILNLHGSDDFDESYDFDDLENSEVVEEEERSSGFFVKAMITVFAVVGIAYGANLALNVNNGNRAEFGQGVTLQATCDTNGGITVTPYSGFLNNAGSGKFALDSIILENVDDTCVGKDFILQVFSNTDTTALNLSETATSPGNYQAFNATRFYFQDSATVTMMSNQYTDVELLTDVESSEFASDQSSFQITFDADTYANFADASDVFKITLQTAPHVPGATS